MLQRVDLVLADVEMHGPDCPFRSLSKVNIQQSAYFSTFNICRKRLSQRQNRDNVNEQQISRSPRREDILRTTARTRTARCCDSKHDLISVAKQTHAKKFTESRASAAKHEHAKQKLGKRHRCTFVPTPLAGHPTPITPSRGAQTSVILAKHRTAYGRHRLTHLGFIGRQ